MCARVFVYVLFILAYTSFLSVTNVSHAQWAMKIEKCERPIYFQCANKECILYFLACDGRKDCSDGSDETNSTCNSKTFRCPSLFAMFECSYGACIYKELRCDGKADCADGSDEEGCSGCRSGQFHCSNGQCTDVSKICDGHEDCDDGSDETTHSCNTFKSDISTPPPGSCQLPEHPMHGVYVSVQCESGDRRLVCRNSPGTRVTPNWLLKYSCNANYNLTSNDSPYSVCDNGVWKNSLDCIKLCPPLKSLSVDVRCMFRGQEVSCDKSMKPNTTAVAKCNQHYKEIYKPQYTNLVCQDNGEWSYPLFYCTPDCGMSTNIEATNTSKVEPLISGGVPTNIGQFPWLTAIFLKNERNQWVQRCGGTLISPHIVLTAAHCLVFLEGTVSPANVKVGLGKYYSDFYRQENHSVIADVREIVVPRYYAGRASLYALDIGLLDLVISVKVTALIMPACVDWTSSITVNPGTVGHIAGWGTTENGTASETVLLAQLSYINNTACINRVGQAYKTYISHDKFCGGILNGSQVNKGDSGGGLTFVNNGQHFVFGVVSTKITEETSFSLFTDLTNLEHHTWLEDERTRLDRSHSET